MDEKKVMSQLFGAAWRIGREQLRQQRKTLKVLYEAARDANDSLPGAIPVRLDKLTDEDYQLLLKWFEDDGTARGARDAYASAVVLFIDNLLKGVLRFYRLIPRITMTFVSGVNGVSTDDIFRFTGNNVRHYDEWRAPTHQIPKAQQAYDAVVAIAKVVKRDVPKKEELSGMAVNWAWPVLFAISNGTFDGLISRIHEFMDEMLVNTGMGSDAYVLLEIAKET